MTNAPRTSRLAPALRIAALVVLLATVGVWVGTGARRGWTQTSKVVMHHDEIADINYPVREKTFVAGVEVLALGAGLSAALAIAARVVRRRA